MNPNVKYLNDLARQLDDLKIGMIDDEFKTMSKAECERLLANIRDFYNYMEKGLDVIASVLESKGGVSH